MSRRTRDAAPLHTEELNVLNTGNTKESDLAPAQVNQQAECPYKLLTARDHVLLSLYPYM